MKTQDIRDMGLAMQQVQEADAVGADGAISGRDDDPAVIAARKKMRADHAAKKAAGKSYSMSGKPDLSGASTAQLKAILKAKNSDRNKPKNEDTVNELSKKTMGSYIKKATSDVQVANIDRGMAMSGKWTLDPKKDKIGVDAAKKGSKRQAGISKAVDKLVKTEAVGTAGYKSYAKDMGMKTEDIKSMGLAHRQVQEAGTATHKPNNGSDPEQGISPNAKKEKDRTSGVGVDANKSIDMSFKAFKAMNKTAPQNGGRTPPGDKAIVKSTTAPAANQKTESVTPGCTCENCTCDPCMCGQDDVIGEKYGGVKKGKPIKGTIGQPVKAAYHGEAKKAKKDDKLDDGDGMDPVGKADADIDNDGDTDKTDDYLNNRRDAIRSKMKGKKKTEKAGDKVVMHGGKGGAKSEKKDSEVMNEVSPALLKRYIKKSDKQAVKSFDKAIDHEDDKDSTKHDKIYNHGLKRGQGATKARDKLVAKGQKAPNYPTGDRHESVNVDEISTDMQNRYMKKAVPQYKKANDKKELGAFGSATQKGADSNQKKYDKRHKGIGSVIKRKASGGISTKTDRAIASDPKRNSMTGKPAPYKG